MKLLALLLSSLVILHSSFAAAPRFNVLFVAVDDLRPEFGACGAGQIHSPNLDRLTLNHHGPREPGMNDLQWQFRNWHNFTCLFGDVTIRSSFEEHS